MLIRLLLVLSITLAVAPVMAREMVSTPTAGGRIYSHGTIRSAREAVVEVAVELMSNIRPGQQVQMDVRQGRLRGTVRDVRSPLEISIALDGSRSMIRLSRLQPGQEVFAVIQLDEAECDCSSAGKNLP